MKCEKIDRIFVPRLTEKADEQKKAGKKVLINKIFF